MATRTLIISNLPAECDEDWLRREARRPEIIASVQVMKPADVEKHGVTLIVEFDGSQAEVDSLVSRFHGADIGGRKARLYAPIFSH